MKQVITIIGAGMMGTAMSRPATDNGYEIRLIGTPLDRDIIDSVRRSGEHPALRRKMPEGVKAFQFEELAEAIPGTTLFLCGVSSFGVPWFAENVLPFLPENAEMLSITKGLNAYPDGRLEPFPEYFQSLRPDMDFFAIGGPCISFELFDRRQTIVYFCGKNIRKTEKIGALFRTKYYHPLPTDEVLSVECGVALKNAYAMGVSLAVGLASPEKGTSGKEPEDFSCRPGAPNDNCVYNPQAALFAQSCLEMRRIAEMLGARNDMISGFAGAGDLYVTIFGGRTRRLGTLLGRGLSFSEAKKALNGVTLESVSIVSRMDSCLKIRANRGEINLSKFPLMRHMASLLREEASSPEPDWSLFG